MLEHLQGQVSKRFSLTVIHEVTHELQNPADHSRQRSGTGFCGSGTGSTGEEHTGLWEVRVKEAQQSSRRRERREDSRAEQAIIIHLTQLRETQEEQEEQTSEVTPLHYFHTVWIFFSFKRPNNLFHHLGRSETSSPRAGCRPTAPEPGCGRPQLLEQRNPSCEGPRALKRSGSGRRSPSPAAPLSGAHRHTLTAASVHSTAAPAGRGSAGSGHLGDRKRRQTRSQQHYMVQSSVQLQSPTVVPLQSSTQHRKSQTVKRLSGQQVSDAGPQDQGLLTGAELQQGDQRENVTIQLSQNF